MPWLCCHRNPKAKREDQYKVADEEVMQPPAGDIQKKNMFSWERRSQIDIEDFRVHDINDATEVRRGIAGQPMIIENCKNSNILVLDHTSTITVDDCNDCLIVLAPCAGRDCRMLRIALHCSTQPIIEETSEVVFHPLTMHYDTFVDHMIAAHLSIFTSHSKSVHDFTPEEGSTHYRINKEVLPMSTVHASVLNAHGVSADVNDSDIPFHESKISPSHYYCAAYSGAVPRHHFVTQCQEVARALFVSPSLRLVSSIELDVRKHGTKIGMPVEGISALVVFEVCGEEEDLDHLMNSSDAGFKKVPEYEKGSVLSVISHVNQLMLS